MSKTVTIIGQGYVGLPLAEEATRAGWKVYGYDVSDRVVNGLNSGISHIDDLTDEDIAGMVERGYEATTDPRCIAESQVSVVCVPTPLGAAGSPDLKYVEAATQTVGDHLAKGATYILESTTYPGTTDGICLPILEAASGMKAGEDFFMAYSPERVDPGRIDFQIKNTPKLVGGINDASTEHAVDFYSHFVDTVVPVRGTKEAETSKLLENTFRHVNIALVNEMAKFCKELGIDIWEVIRGASTKPFGFMKFTPSAGVGGHCIPIDPNYLSYEVRNRLGYPFRFVELAQEINNSMPRYVVSRSSELLNHQAKALNGSKVLLLGVTYKPNIADQRESPAVPVAEEFLNRMAELSFHDPLVETWNLSKDYSLERESDLQKAVEEADLVVLLQAHKAYDLENIRNSAKLFFDTTGKSDSPAQFKL
ncbi:nucleotide sugar dehydrogenase [Corynebacterium casei]|uniref:nucleotide sugar dehydrogenase n=1 Tax=Corynebacterium casei TaxID=160386 RepID=UPI003FD1EE97